MRIGILGLGNADCVGAACLAKPGHHVSNDVSENKVRLINEGKPTIIVAETEELVLEGREKGFIEASVDVQYTADTSDISFICVGTPSGKQGYLNC